MGKKTQIGEMAHIYSHSNNFIRTDSNLSSDDKRSEKNFILLCPTGHKIIDTNPEKYPPERLLEIKEKHINKIRTLKETAMLDFTFDDLNMASRNIIGKNNVFSEKNNLQIGSPPLDIEVKMRVNLLTQISSDLLIKGNLKQNQVKKFISYMTKEDDNFPSRLQYSFKKEYDKKKNKFKGDKLFLEMYEFTQKNLTKETEKSASLAILCYLFSLCVIFKTD
jgi:hypothetical protein